MRIHTEQTAAEAARVVNAFTVDNDMFGVGRYSTDRSGHRLLAHELVYVVQQNGATTLDRQAIDGGSVPPAGDEERAPTGTRQSTGTLDFLSDGVLGRGHPSGQAPCSGRESRDTLVVHAVPGGNGGSRGMEV